MKGGRTAVTQYHIIKSNAAKSELALTPGNLAPSKKRKAITADKKAANKERKTSKNTTRKKPNDVNEETNVTQDNSNSLTRDDITPHTPSVVLFSIPDTLIPLSLWQKSTVTYKTAVDISKWQTFPQQVVTNIATKGKETAIIKNQDAISIINASGKQILPCGCENRPEFGRVWDGFACGHCKEMFAVIGKKQMEWMLDKFDNGTISKVEEVEDNMLGENLDYIGEEDN
jgi:hypothetical protein